MLQEEILDYWTKRAPGYSHINQKELHGRQKEKWTAFIRGRIEARLPGKKHIQVLDIGAGPGFFSIILTMAGYEVTAVDRNPTMIQEAKKNAGPLAKKIHYVEMDAEALEFPEGSFDVIVTRNLMWTLPHPEKAYASWRHVLKEGGFLLNFDANWYHYLYDEEARRQYEADRAQVASRGMEDRYTSTDIQTMEHIARQVPLSSLQRPQWDKEVLQKLGMKDIVIHDHVAEQVLLEEEQVNFHATPYFCVESEK